MRTDTSIEGFTHTFPNELVFLGDKSFVKIEGETALGTIIVRCYDASTMVGRYLQYSAGSRTSATLQLTELFKVMYSAGTTAILLRTTCNGARFADQTIYLRKGITLPYRDHGCTRTYSVLFGNHIQHLVPMAGATRYWWTDGEVHQSYYAGWQNTELDVDMNGIAEVTMDWDSGDQGAWDADNAPLIGLGTREILWHPYQTINYPVAVDGDYWRNAGQTTAYIRPWDTNGLGVSCLPKDGGIALVWDNIDGNRVYAVGKVASDTLSVEQTEFRLPSASEINTLPGRLVTGNAKEIVVEFIGIPRTMYLDEMLLSEEVFYTSTDLSDLHPCIPSSLVVTKDGKDIQDITITLKIAM